MSLLGETLTALNPRSLKTASHHLQGLLRQYLWAKVILAFVLAIALGLAITQGYLPLGAKATEALREWAAFPGYLFLRIIQMIVLPLIFASVMLGVASSENIEQLKKLGLRIALYFVGTTIVSLCIGFFVATLIRPGRFLSSHLLEGAAVPDNVQGAGAKTLSLQEQVLSLFPQNPFSAFNEGDMLQIVIFSLIVGVALISMRAEQAKPLLHLMESMQEVCMTIVKWSMSLAPFAVFGLTLSMVCSVGTQALLGLAVYILTVVLGLTLVLCFYLLMIFFVAKRNPLEFLKKVFSLQLLAFSTSSSAAVMPMSLKTAEDDLNIKGSVAQFVIPLGSTINMDGTAMYQMVATVFLAQAYGIDLSSGQMILIGLTAVGASIGSPGTPGVGIVILASILQTAGIPLEGTGLIMAVDRILDMLRTVVNVTGDVTAASVMDKMID